MNEKQPISEEITAWHVTKTLTGKVLEKEQILPGKQIPFGDNYFTTTSVELNEEGQPLLIKRIKGRDEIVEVRSIRRTIERFNLFGNRFRQEIVISQKNARA